MAAVAQLNEYNGAGTSESVSIANMNFGNVDASALTPASYPVRVQAGGFSFDKFFKLKFTGTFTSLSRFKVWKNSGDYFTNEVINTNVTTANYTTLAYTTPAVTENTDLGQTLPTSEPSGGDNTGANIEVGNALTIAITVTSTLTDYIGMQTSVAADTETGAGNQKVIRFQWDEQ